jgi:uncharacterized protein with NAD-binding domain and iron-sulfur cluster
MHTSQVFFPLSCLSSFTSMSNHTHLTWCSTACDVPGIKRLLPSEWREWEMFDNIYKLDGVPVVTVQLRYNGWVTELQDLEKSR